MRDRDKIQAMSIEPDFILTPGPKRVSNVWKASLTIAIIRDCSQTLWCRSKSRRWVMGSVDEGGGSHIDDLSSRVLSFPFLPI